MPPPPVQYPLIHVPPANPGQPSRAGSGSAGRRDTLDSSGSADGRGSIGIVNTLGDRPPKPIFLHIGARCYYWGEIVLSIINIISNVIAFLVLCLVLTDFSPPERDYIIECPKHEVTGGHRGQIITENCFKNSQPVGEYTIVGAGPISGSCFYTCYLNSSIPALGAIMLLFYILHTIAAVLVLLINTETVQVLLPPSFWYRTAFCITGISSCIVAFIGFLDGRGASVSYLEPNTSYRVPDAAWLPQLLLSFLYCLSTMFVGSSAIAKKLRYKRTMRKLSSQESN